MRGGSRAAAASAAPSTRNHRAADTRNVKLEADNYDDGRPSDTPPSKRRKLDDSPQTRRRSTSARTISPPWKRIAVEGPTSFVEAGRRKSSRTNAVPLELQPLTDKRQTRATLQSKPVTKSRYGGKSLGDAAPPKKNASTQSRAAMPPPPLPQKRRVGRPSKRDLAQQSSAQSSAPSPTQKRPAHKTVPAKPPTTRKLRPSSSMPSLQEQPKRKPGRPARKAPPQKTRRSLRAIKVASPDGKREDEESEDRSSEAESDSVMASDSDEPVEVDPNARTPRLKFRVRLPTVPVTHPSHLLPPKKYASFQESYEEEASLPPEEVVKMTNEEARREAHMQRRLQREAKPGGVLDPERASNNVPSRQIEPDRFFGHQDHLVAHALHFRKLLDKERERHRNGARKLATAAAIEWKRRQPKTLEEMEREERDATLARFKQVRKDLQSKWDMVGFEVNKRRLVRWEEERQVLGKQALNEMLEHSTQLLDARRLRRPSEEVTDEESEADSQASSGEDEASDEETAESNMSSAESVEDEVMGDDEGLTVDELRRKYAQLPEHEESVERSAEEMDASDEEPDLPDEQFVQSSPGPRREGSLDDLYGLRSMDTPEAAEAPATEAEDVEEAWLDESDESVDMDDDLGDRGSSEEDSDGGVEEVGEDDHESMDEDGPGLLGFFGTGDRSGVAATTPDLTSEMDIVEAEEPEEADDTPAGEDIAKNQEPLGVVKAQQRIPPKDDNMLQVRADNTPDVERMSANPSSQASPGTNATTKASEIDSASSIELHADSQHPSSTTTPQPSFNLKTPIPFLLRGTLREYQHYGLDWLAGLYANRTNGILADEMGLGKTIQTIALLAHLACVHEVWGPHLIVVPTSVMLNWEMEFKKWCPGFKILTYYGTQEERKQKRKGWLNDDLWNVCITSYQLVLQDQMAFKRRNWHYMVLDEAHNIKNFRSQRWQILLNFKTRARLLLTGTPLQNNLTELWSLLFFLMPADESEKGIGGFADLQEFSEWFRRPVEQILEHGRDTMDDEAKGVVAKLHKVLRPYLLRRLKMDVEKQMPAKHEHVVYCRLSKRQRYLYDGFMALGQTRETLSSGNYLSIINCLMQLRKVCNHPDLFETRQIVTSFAMPKAVVADFEIKELLVRRRLLREDPMRKVNPDFLNLTPTSKEHCSHISASESARIIGLPYIQDLCYLQLNRINWNQDFDVSTVQSALDHMETADKIARNEELRHAIYVAAFRSQSHPIYGQGLVDRLTITTGLQSLAPAPESGLQLLDWYLNTSEYVRAAVSSVSQRAEMMEPFVQKFGCITPSVTAMDMPSYALTRQGALALQESRLSEEPDPFHEARVRLSIAFPDKRLLQYDCGKLQRLDKLLRDLSAGGHRALIFTQMTKVLDILEQFLNIHGHRYLRLDGNTKVEQRQVLTERFNSDPRILAFILSSRSGGLGINLTGADTVIFYDLDWNPAMDKQCQDRCHRIGQTRDVHIYRFVSEYTIEANILRKANQKRMLDDVVIQEGEFTTDYFNKLSIRDMLGDDASTALEDGDASANAAMDRVLGNSDGEGDVGKVLEQVEDAEDTEAARMAEKEVTTVDNADFDEKASADGAPTPKDANANPSRDASMPPPPLPPPSRAAAGDAKSPSTAAPRVETTVTLDAAESGLAAVSGPNDEEDTNMLDAEADDDAAGEPGHIDEYMLRFIEWELRDVPVAPAIDKSKARKKAKKAHQVKRAPK